MSSRRLTCVLAASAALVTLSVPARAQDAWLSVSGEVVQVGPGQFTMRHEGSLVLVEMTGWKVGPRAAGIGEGDRVTVSGSDRHDFRKSGRLAAFSVFNHTDQAAYRADLAKVADTIDAGHAAPDVAAAVDTTALVGTVARIEGREFVLRTDDGTVRIDTAGLIYDPFAADSAMPVGAGDRVSVSGAFVGDGRRRLRADGVVVLDEGSSTPQTSSASSAR